MVKVKERERVPLGRHVGKWPAAAASALAAVVDGEFVVVVVVVVVVADVVAEFGF